MSILWKEVHEREESELSKNKGRKKGISYEVKQEHRKVIEEIRNRLENVHVIVRDGVNEFLETGNKSLGTRVRQDIRRLEKVANELWTACNTAGKDMREIPANLLK